MRKFSIQMNPFARKHQTRFRLVWGAVLLTAATSLALFILGFMGLRGGPVLGGLLVSSTLGALVGASILACREALRLAERQMVFVLDDAGIVRRRKGFPDVRIAFPEIDMLREELRWLVVYSTEPRRKIAIPNDVGEFEEIRAALVRHHPLSRQPGPRAAFPWRSIALPTVSVLGWAGVLLFHDMKVLIPAAVVAISTVGIASRHLWVRLHPTPKRSLLCFSLGSAWLTTILLIYFRIRQL